MERRLDLVAASAADARAGAAALAALGADLRRQARRLTGARYAHVRAELRAQAADAEAAAARLGDAAGRRRVAA
jgi:hypothetical protein